MTSAVLPFPNAQIVRFQAAVSPGTLAGLLAGRPCDPRALRAAFPERWGRFVRAHFRNPLEVAVFFDVDEKTGRLWWEGSHGPQGWVVDFAIRSIPDAQHWLDAA